jgi:TIR domain
MTVDRPSVFISYAHEDEAWKDRLVSHLRVLEWEGTLDVWDDRRIAAGDDWRPEIEQAIERAEVAILIVSKDFLTSKFIREQELTSILEGRAKGRLWVIPLIAEACAWQVVGVLQGIQARPRDGRPLSAGNENQINSDLSELATEVNKRLEPKAAPGQLRARSGWRSAPVTRSTWLLGCLGASGVLAALLTVGATYWRLSTFVSLGLVTERISFVVRGTRQILDPGLPFSALTVERCGSATFDGVELVSVSEPPGTGVGSPMAPATELTCRDPDAKLTLASAGDAPTDIGALGAIGLEPGTTVSIEVAGQQRNPVLTLELSGHPLTLDIPIEHTLDVVADLVEVGPTPVSGTPGLVRFGGTLSDAPRHVARLETSDRGAVLVATRTEGSLGAAFNRQDRFPVESVRLDKETRGGVATTALLGDASLSYPDAPTIPGLSVPKDNAIILERMENAQVRGLRLAHFKPSASGAAVPAIMVTVEGQLVRGEVGAGDPGHPDQPNQGRWSDPRLTAYDVITNGRWKLAAAAAAWTATTLGAAYLGWRKLPL